MELNTNVYPERYKGSGKSRRKDKIVLRPTKTGVAELQEEAVNSDFFRTDNLRNLPACLDLHLSETKRRALPYSYIMEVLFDGTINLSW